MTLTACYTNREIVTMALKCTVFELKAWDRQTDRRMDRLHQCLMPPYGLEHNIAELVCSAVRLITCVAAKAFIYFSLVIYNNSTKISLCSASYVSRQHATAHICLPHNAAVARLLLTAGSPTVQQSIDSGARTVANPPQWRTAAGWDRQTDGQTDECKTVS